MAIPISIQNAPIPTQEPIAQPRRKEIPRDKDDPQEGLPTTTWVEYFTANNTQVQAAQRRVNSVLLTQQTASIGATDFSGGNTTDGAYEIQYNVRVTSPSGGASTVQVTVSWTDGGVVQSVTGSLVNGNTTTSQNALTFPIMADGGAPITYAIAYTSAPPGMVYRFFGCVQAIQT